MINRVAIVGAPGAVGRELLDLFAEGRLPAVEVKAYASHAEHGTLLAHDDEPLVVLDLEKEVDPFAGIDVAFFFGDAEAARRHVAEALRTGAVVIDGTGAHVRETHVQLTIAGVNWRRATDAWPLYLVPSSLATIAGTVLLPLHQAFGLRRVAMSSYQSVSSLGRPAMDDLFEQSVSIARGQEPIPVMFEHQIAYNLIPWIGAILSDGESTEEKEVGYQLTRLLEVPALDVSMACVRVPVFIGEAATVTVETERPVDLRTAHETLDQVSIITVVRDCTKDRLDPLRAGLEENVLVGRVRVDAAVGNRLHFFVVADNLRRGSALNAIEIASRHFA
ncbi:MAG: aspartate-semialdehyde dehydrogenase [Candidatus Schekmanbacteria bacterium]|nr:aspartate-semialdehyde dehydrogenase [Candidatus Schekmanbacteria bacterium]